MLRPDWNTISKEEKLEAIRAGKLAGLSSSMIAAQFSNCTRNAIIGVAHRGKIDLSHAPAITKNRTAGDPVPRNPKMTRRVKPKPAPIASAPVEEPTADDQRSALPFDIEGVVDETPPSDGGVPMMALKEHHCHWPMWPNRMGTTQRVPFDEIVFCGAPVPEGSRYCEPHHRRAIRRDDGGSAR